MLRPNTSTLFPNLQLKLKVLESWLILATEVKLLFTWMHAIGFLFLQYQNDSVKQIVIDSAVLAQCFTFVRWNFFKIQERIYRIVKIFWFICFFKSSSLLWIWINDGEIFFLSKMWRCPIFDGTSWRSQCDQLVFPKGWSYQFVTWIVWENMTVPNYGLTNGPVKCISFSFPMIVKWSHYLC